MNKTDRKEASAELAGRLREMVNEYQETLSVEDVAGIFAEEGCSILDCLAWMPHSQRAAYEHFASALGCLRDGKIIPVPGFNLLFPELEQQ